MPECIDRIYMMMFQRREQVVGSFCNLHDGIVSE